MKRPFSRKCAVIATVLAIAGTSVAAPYASATQGMENPADVRESTPITSAAQQQITEELAGGFETLFTEVIRENADGTWSVDYSAAESFGISPEEAEALVTLMASPETRPDSGTHRRSKRDLESFGRCVLWGVMPFPISKDDAIAVATLLREKRWHDAAEKAVAIAALNGATELLKYGFGAIGGPVGLAAKLAVVAGSCALSERMP